MSTADSACREPVYTTTGEIYAYRTNGSHDWRLHEREPVTEKSQVEYIPQEGAPGYGTVVVHPGTQTGWHEVWYCTKCRIVDVREVETDD